MAESRMPPEVYEKLQMSLADTQSELEMAQSHIRDVEAVNTKLAHRLDMMTPRPVWRKIAQHNIQVSESRYRYTPSSTPSIPSAPAAATATSAASVSGRHMTVINEHVPHSHLR